jgi:hypothetical protein
VQESILVVDADALVVAAIDQAVTQGETATDSGLADEQVSLPPAEVSQWSGQQAEVAQIVTASARGEQAGVGNTGGTVNEAAATATSEGVAETSQDVDQFMRGFGPRSQWAGQLAQVGQAVDAVAAVTQNGESRGRSRSATASSQAGATSITAQASLQGASGLGNSAQTSAQLVIVLQEASATSSTAQPSDQAPGPDGAVHATSESYAFDASLAVQAAEQLLDGSGTQVVVQNTLVEQRAVATSLSQGGIGGIAVVANCATVGQSSSQVIGGAASPLLGGLGSFCTPPAKPGGSGGRAGTGSATAAVSLSAAVAVAPAEIPVEELEPWPPHGRFVDHAAAASRRHGRALDSTYHAAAPAAAPAQAARSLGVQVSTLPAGRPVPGLVRIEGSVEQTGVEPPLSPVSGVFAGSGSASPVSVGGGGVAAILAAFVISLLGGLRKLSESAVRRPAFVTGRLETPG